jgi:outer membrane receptor protein involved in Fe transport
MKLFLRKAALFSTVLALLVAVPALAQTTGTLTGTVTTEGAPLPGVTVSISSPSLQGTRTAITDSNGNYTFGALPPGTYAVTFELEGMQRITRSVQVNLAGTARADASLGLSAVAEAITVTAAAPTVLETQQIQTSIESSLIEELPIGRTLVATVNLAPGVTNNGVGGNLVISGAPSYDSTYYINGSVVNEVMRGQPLDVFIEDALEETTVLTGAISAEYGRFTGGVVTAISKSGGNEFSGSLRDSLTNPKWGESTPLGEARPDSLSETYEGTFGGRIIRDRLWFFTAGRYIEQSQARVFNDSTIPYSTDREQIRLEGKLTGQITPRHTLVGSILDLSDELSNRCLGGGGCWEPRSLASAEELPQDLLSVQYNGILSKNLLIEANYAESSLSFIGSGGQPGGFAEATNLYFANTGGWGGAPSFCGGCDDEVRETDALSLKATYYLSTGLGTHNIVVGGEDFRESILSNNYQSGSNFTVWTYADPTRDANGNLLAGIGRNAGFIIWWPVLQLSQGNDIGTQSLFINDRWDVNNRLSFNIGARYDQNDGRDSAGGRVADDSKISPRLGVIYDLFGDGRIRLNASYSQYASKISNGNIGDAASPAGSPSILYWLYGGPTLTNLPTQELLAQINTWFESVGGIENRSWLLGGGTNGISTIIPRSLQSPGVDEITLGAAFAIGQRGHFRVDVQDREWNDFYTTRVDQSTGRVEDPLVGGEIDLAHLENSDNFERTYRALLLQGGYRLTQRLNIGANYTLSELKGNLRGETTGSGPISGAAGPTYYPEFLNFEQNNPVGYMPEDQRHKARLWVSYDQPTPIGNFNFSLLQRFDSGTPYSVTGAIDVTQEDGCDVCRANNGMYVTVPTAVTYYFSKRGEFRWDDVTSTDLAVNYSLPIGPVQLFVQGEMLNVFNESAQVGGNLSVFTARNRGDLQYFDPFSTPVQSLIECPQGAQASQCEAMGAHWQKGLRFGDATTSTTQAAQGHYQLPRIYRFSVGLRF